MLNTHHHKLIACSHEHLRDIVILLSRRVPSRPEINDRESEFLVESPHERLSRAEVLRLAPLPSVVPLRPGGRAECAENVALARSDQNQGLRGLIDTANICQIRQMC